MPVIGSLPLGEDAELKLDASKARRTFEAAAGVPNLPISHNFIGAEKKSVHASTAHQLQ